ncbi:MAG: NAD(P)H-dependent oxidoreductase [Marinoscillum sp.]
MEKIKLAIIYYSSTGTNFQLSKWAEEAAIEADADIKRLKFPETAPQEAIDANDAWKKFSESSENQNEAEVTLDDLEWADAIIFSIPTRYGNLPSQVQAFFDTTGGLWFEGKLANKIVSGMTSAMNPHGGQESTLQSLYKTMIHWGCIIVPPAYTFEDSFKAGGNPYGTSTTSTMEGQVKDDVENAVKMQAKRTVEMTKRFLGVSEMVETNP